MRQILHKAKANTPDTFSVQLPDCVRYPVFAIGDVHGQQDRLQALLTLLRRRKEWSQATLVFLGDFIDRGPESRGVLDDVVGLCREGKATAIMGNHDYALVRAAGLDGREPSEFWRLAYETRYDADTTMLSYGGELDLDLPLREKLSVRNLFLPRFAVADLAARMPKAHKQFLANLPWGVFIGDSWTSRKGGHLAIHCGLSDRLRLNIGQQISCLRRREWPARHHVLRDYNRTHEYPDWFGGDRYLADQPLPWKGVVQVSGHDKVSQPYANRTRIRIDTSGGYDDFPLTAALLSGPGCRPKYISTEEDEYRPWGTWIRGVE